MKTKLYRVDEVLVEVMMLGAASKLSGAGVMTLYRRDTDPEGTEFWRQVKCLDPIDVEHEVILALLNAYGDEWEVTYGDE